MHKLAQQSPSASDIISLIKHNLQVLLMNSELETSTIRINPAQVKINVTPGTQNTPTAVNTELPLAPNDRQTDLLTKNIFATLNKAYPSVEFLVTVSGATGVFASASDALFYKAAYFARLTGA